MEENGSIRFTPDSLICSDSSNGIRKLGNTGCLNAQPIDTTGDKSMKKTKRLGWHWPDQDL